MIVRIHVSLLFIFPLIINLIINLFSSRVELIGIPSVHLKLRYSLTRWGSKQWFHSSWLSFFHLIHHNYFLTHLVLPVVQNVPWKLHAIYLPGRNGSFETTTLLDKVLHQHGSCDSNQIHYKNNKNTHKQVPFNLHVTSEKNSINFI